MEVIHVTKMNLKVKPLRSRNISENVEKIDDNNVKKCLFGAPQLDDLENLLKEQMEADWDRIRIRFGINLEDMESVENTPTRRRKFRENCRKSANFKRRCLFLPYNNTKKITDFFQVRKNSAQQTENEKENGDEA